MKLNLDEQLRMKKVMDVLNSKITLVLPDLMSSNTKLGERLKNKLKVSTLFNNIEHRNRKYLKGFINSSNKRANFLKTGLEMNKAIKQSTKGIQSLCKEMDGDLILQNMDLLLNEKKLISENTEQETHMKLTNLLSVMKKAIKPSLLSAKEEDKNDVKILTEDEMYKMKDYMGNKIDKEHEDIQNNINNYINVVNNAFKGEEFENEENKAKIKRNFSRFVETINFQKNIKLINYKKPKPQQIKDKESANLLRIKKLLYPSNIKKSEINDENNNKQLNHIIRRNSSMNNIYNKNNYEALGKTTDNNNADKLKNIEVNGQDTMQVLTKLKEQKDYLTERMQQKIKRVNSLIEIKLPYLSNYENILNYVNRNNKSISQRKNISENINNNNEKMVFSPISEIKNTKCEIQPFMRRKILALKSDIQLISHNNELFNKNFYENKRMTIYKKLRGTLDKANIKIYNRKDIDCSKNNSDKKGENVFITEKK